jgi:hypothetical protein
LYSAKHVAQSKFSATAEQCFASLMISHGIPEPFQKSTADSQRACKLHVNITDSGDSVIVRFCHNVANLHTSGIKFNAPSVMHLVEEFV